LGPPGGPLVGPNFRIDSALGEIRSGNGTTNLFHSFSEFNILAGESATFTHLAGGTINNVLSRITGASPSTINGLLASEIPGANFYLINPRGVMFGPNAVLDIGATIGQPGSFIVSTADYVRLGTVGEAGAGIFSAHPLISNVLTSAPVTAFGFLGPPTAITFEGSRLPGDLLNPAIHPETGNPIPVPAGQTFAVIGGDVTVGPDPSTGTPASVVAPGGQIDIFSTRSAGELQYPTFAYARNVNGDTFTTKGTVRLTDTPGTPGTLDVTDLLFEGTGASGSIRIRGGRFEMDNARVIADTIADVAGANPAIRVDMTDDVILKNGSLLLTENFGPAGSGDIEVRGGIVKVESGSSIETSSLDGGLDLGSIGPSGSITVTASKSIIVTGTGRSINLRSTIKTEASDAAADSGSITLSAPTVTVKDLGLVRTSVASSGRTGSIHIIDNPVENIIVKDLNVLNGGAIEIRNQAKGPGFGATGELRIDTADSVTVSGRFNPANPSRILHQRNDLASTSEVGLLSIETGKFLLANGAALEADGDLTAGVHVGISATQSATLSDGGLIAIANGSQEAGSLTMTAPAISITGSEIRGRTFIARDAGAMMLEATAGNLELSNGSRIRTSTENNSGNAGPLTLMATDSVILSGGSSAESNSVNFSRGDGGILTVYAGNLISLSGEGTGLFSNADATSSGNGGAIVGRAGRFLITNGAVVSASSAGTGAAGSITLQGTASPAQSLTISGPGSGLFTETSNTGSGSDIIAWSHELDLTDGATISSRTTGQMPGAGDAGTILVKADDITISGGATITAASTGTGNAGTVTIQGTHSPAQSLLITGAGSGVFTTTSGTGTGGDILALSDSVLLTNGGTLSAATSGTSPSAVGGTVGLMANTVRIENGALVTAASSGPANGGDIAILTEQSVTVNSQGAVSTRATGAGDAGSIGILAGGDFLIGGGSVSTTAAQGTGGDILVAAGQDIRLTDQASLSANSSGPGNAGGITALAGDDFIMINSSITTQAAQASGGNIKIGAADAIQITNSLVSASVQGGSGSGGNIDIDPRLVLLQNSQVRANAVFGNGGNITITTPLFFADQTSIVDASSQFGVNGTVTIQSPTSNLAGTVATLPSSMRQAQSLQTGRCAALANSQSSSFVVAGRETVPAEPGGWLPSPFASLNAGEGRVAQDNGEGLEARSKEQRLSDEDVSGLSRASDQRHATNHMLDRADPIDQGDQVVLSLRRLTPAGFLTQSFAESRSMGCRS
jgi:filamentous hemagglutinin family protein